MAKKIFLIIISILSCTALFSQQSNDDIFIPDTPCERSYSIATGPKLGLNTSNGTTSSYGFGFNHGLGYHIGACGKMHFGRRFESSFSGTGLFGAQVEFLYEERHPKNDLQPITLRCIEVPVMFQYYPFASLASELAFEIGFTYVNTLSCTPEQLQHNNVIIQTGQLSSKDIMISLGVCYVTPFDISFDLRYNLGTMPLAGNFDCKINTFTASAVYYFNL